MSILIFKPQMYIIKYLQKQNRAVQQKEFSKNVLYNEIATTEKIFRQWVATEKKLLLLP